ncbi:MAG: hypothetical protein JXA22_01940 [Candidatus Thermoplasmatota archaeon]|nr:hypothetical protein [Candidatus Thermoplasmatota archaeon]
MDVIGEILSGGDAVKRVATLDFVRGLCIMGMVTLHVFGRVYDSSWIGTDQMSNKSLLHITGLLTLAYMGGMAGLFLMVSATSHTLSIHGQLGKGKKLESVMIKQIAAGILLLLFAFLAESTIGHHGFLGRMAYCDVSSGASLVEAVSANSDRILYRGFHFMTLHTIAWCIIINSVIQYVLYRNGGVGKVARNVKAYIGLSAMAVLLTPIMWWMAGQIVPGYPFATYPQTDLMVQYPLAGESGVLDHVKLFFLGPLAGQTEPLFPFLFISFIGAIIGIYLSMDRPPRLLPHKGMMIGGIMFLLGVSGIAFMWLTGADSVQNLIENTYQVLRLRIWFPLLLLTTGGQLVFLMMTIRLVEYRGIGAAFASMTTFFRRFGAVSLTIYTFQYLDTVPLNLISLFPGVNVVSGREGLFWAVLAVVGSLLTWHFVLLLWEKKEFKGSAEWAFAVTLAQFTGIFKRKDRTSRLKWYEVPRLTLTRADIDVEWLGVVPTNPRGLDRFRDSILSMYLAFIGLVILPLSILAHSVAKRARETEGENRFNALSLKVSRWGLAWGSFAAFWMSQIKGISI